MTSDDFAVSFCENFKVKLKDGTIDPNETEAETGCPGLDSLAGTYLFCDDPGLSSKLYELLAWKVDHEMKHSYRIKCSKPLLFFCVKEERLCNRHCDFIEITNGCDYRFKKVAHAQVLEILKCYLSKNQNGRTLALREFNPLYRLEELMGKYKKVKEEHLKVTMLCLKEKGCSIPATNAIASMIKTGRSDAFKEERNGN